MPEEVMVVIIVSVIAGAIAITSIAKHLIKWMAGAYEKGGSSGTSLKTSELEELIRAAVREETQPLHEEIERLGRRLEEKIPRRVEPPEDEHRFGLLADTEHLRSKEEQEQA